MVVVVDVVVAAVVVAMVVAAVVAFCDKLGGAYNTSPLRACISG